MLGHFHFTFIFIFLYFKITFVSACIPTQQIEEGIIEVVTTTTSTSTSLSLEPLVTSSSTTSTSTSTSTTTSTTTTTTTTTTTSPILSCLDDTWIMVDRTTYYWCMKVLKTTVISSEGLAACQTLDPAAKVSGLQNTEEVTTISSAALSQGLNAVLIGAQRTAACMLVSLTATCTTLTSFYWTDGYTTGTEAFNWRTGQPDNSGVGQSYAIIWTTTGLMDDAYSFGLNGGVICGMLPDYY